MKKLIRKELLLEWEPKTVINKLYGEIESLIHGDEKPDIAQLTLFCTSDYEQQREMIFQYLFGVSSTEAMTDQLLRIEIQNKVFKTGGN